MKKAIKNLSLALGFASIILTAANGTAEIELNKIAEKEKCECNILNGLLGLNRDINLKLMQYMSNVIDIVEILCTSTEFLVWKKHFLFKIALHTKRYDIVFKSTLVSDAEIYTFISEDLLFRNLTIRDFCFSCANYQPLLSFLLGAPYCSRNGERLVYLSLCRVLETMWKRNKHDYKSFNTMMLGNIDDQGNSILTFWAELVITSKNRPTSIQNLCFYASALVRKCHVDFSFPAPNGKTVSNIMPGFRRLLEEIISGAWNDY
ncbi:MAG: hypothetical protein LBB63_02340 [Holosporaceae bacterium]|nr:hypothetical protein [Holosporaceae bacterium]